MQRIGLLLVGVIFLFSGAFALVYEVTWARMLAREFGSDAVSIAIVVSVFMLGLGVGARIAGVWGDGFRNPLRIYGYLEILLGFYVLISSWLIGFFAPFLGLLGHGAIENPWILNSARTLLGMALLLPPTLLMGASLPLLVRFAADVAKHAPAAIIGLYAINIAGAVVGVIAAGFWLLPAMGMTSVLWIVAIANIVMGLLVLVLSTHFTDAHVSRSGRKPTAEPLHVASTELTLPLAAMLVGVASMACQLAWTRVIVLIVGGSAYAFSSVLAVFLAGLGLGAGLAAFSTRWSGERTLLFFGLAGLLSVITIFASTVVLPLLPGFFLTSFDADLAGTRLGLLNLQIIIAAALFLLPATFMGMLFPLILRIGLGDLIRPANETGKLYLANTFGCVAGALLTGFVLIPMVGILPTLLIAIGILCYSMILVQSRGGHPVLQVTMAVLLMGAYGGGWFLVPPWNSQVMASGLSEYARAYQRVDASLLGEELARRSELLFYRDGQTATVTVSRDRLLLSNELHIATNGKIDGSSHGDMPTQKLIAHLPILLHKKPRNVAVIGMGTGVTAGSATLYKEVENVSVIEIESAMVEGSKLFSAVNHRVHDHPKVSIRVTDGRLHLRLSSEAYDIIVSEPSNPWIAGIASLFSEEFYRLGAEALLEGGIFAQWLQVYNMDPDNIRSVIGTFQGVFPHTYVAVSIIDSDLLLIGSESPIEIDFQSVAARINQAAVSADLADPMVGINTIHELLARIWLVPEDLPRLVNDARQHRDDWPFLMYEAPLSRYLGSNEANTRMVAEGAGSLFRLSGFRDSLTSEDFEALLQAYWHFVPQRYHQHFLGSAASDDGP